MSNLVPVGARDLIFEPTESLSARIISAVEEKNDAEERLKEMEAALHRERGKKNGANLRAMLFFGMIIAAAAAAFFIWIGAQDQIGKAISERDTAVAELDVVEAQLLTAEGTIEDQLVIMRAFDKYRPIVDATYELGRLDQELRQYSREYRNVPTPGLEKSDTIDIVSEHKDWLEAAELEVTGEAKTMTDARDAFLDWLRTRNKPRPVVECLPKNPFRPHAPQPGCPT